MNKFVVVVFADENKASEGVVTLEQLHRDGSITLYAMTVVERDLNGKISVKYRSGEGPIGLGVSTLAGALLGLLGGPAGMAIGASAGALTGMARDVIHAGVSDDFFESVEKELSPGKFAVVAEIAEEWVGPVDTRMGELGGRVTRELRQDFVSEEMEKRTAARRMERELLQRERAGTKADKMAAKLEAQLVEAEHKLQRAADEAKKRLNEAREEMQAKLRALEEQASKASPDVKRRIEQRISETCEDLAVRQSMLTRAFTLATQAIHA